MAPVLLIAKISGSEFPELHCLQITPSCLKLFKQSQKHSGATRTFFVDHLSPIYQIHQILSADKNVQAARFLISRRQISSSTGV